MDSVGVLELLKRMEDQRVREREEQRLREEKWENDISMIRSALQQQQVSGAESGADEEAVFDEEDEQSNADDVVSSIVEELLDIVVDLPPDSSSSSYTSLARSYTIESTDSDGVTDEIVTSGARMLDDSIEGKSSPIIDKNEVEVVEMIENESDGSKRASSSVSSSTSPKDDVDEIAAEITSSASEEAAKTQLKVDELLASNGAVREDEAADEISKDEAEQRFDGAESRHSLLSPIENTSPMSSPSKRLYYANDEIADRASSIIYSYRRSQQQQQVQVDRAPDNRDCVEEIPNFSEHRERRSYTTSPIRLNNCCESQHVGCQQVQERARFQIRQQTTATCHQVVRAGDEQQASPAADCSPAKQSQSFPSIERSQSFAFEREFGALKVRCEYLETLNRNLTTKLTSTEEQLNLTSIRLSEAQYKISESEHYNQRLESDVKDLSQTVADYQSKLYKYEIRTTQLEDQNRVIDKNHKSAQLALQEQATLNERLKQEYRCAQDEYDLLKKDYAMLENELIQTKQDFDGTQRSFNKLQYDFKRLSYENDLLTKRVQVSSSFAPLPTSNNENRPTHSHSFESPRGGPVLMKESPMIQYEREYRSAGIRDRTNKDNTPPPAQSSTLPRQRRSLNRDSIQSIPGFSPRSPVTACPLDKLNIDALSGMRELEEQFDCLLRQKADMEGQLNRLPAQSTSQQLRRHREELEAHIDSLEQQLASVRKTLKRYNMMKSSLN